MHYERCFSVNKSALSPSDFILISYIAKTAFYPQCEHAHSNNNRVSEDLSRKTVDSEYCNTKTITITNTVKPGKRAEKDVSFYNK